MAALIVAVGLEKESPCSDQLMIRSLHLFLRCNRSLSSSRCRSCPFSAATFLLLFQFQLLFLSIYKTNCSHVLMICESVNCIPFSVGFETRALGRKHGVEVHFTIMTFFHMVQCHWGQTEYHPHPLFHLQHHNSAGNAKGRKCFTIEI